jgi:SAM-dependent methyltransferase
MRPCPACNTAAGLRQLWDTNIVRCPTCGLAYVAQLPTLEQLQQMYSESYFQGDSYTDYLGDKAAAQANFQHRIALLRRYQPGGRLFEAGCAYGFFLELAQAYWTADGVDLSADAVRYARETLGVSAQQGDFESHPPETNCYDVVAMWDTIEHLYDPVLAIRKSAEGLRPGGILALTTGDIEALWARARGRHWRLIIPQHLYYFSRQSITHLLRQHGLEVIHFSHVGYRRSLRQIAEALTWNHPRSRWRSGLRNQIRRLPFADRTISLNLFDIMLVIARKPE